MKTITGEREAEGSLETQVTTTPQARQTGNRLPKPARRRQLLAAAQEVFVAQGYHAAAMDEIAERAGVSKPVLYQHFPGKLDLYLALLDESVAALAATVRAALESTTDNKQRVTATFTAFFDFVGSTGQAFRLVFESDLRNEPAVRARLDESSRECAEMISEIISEDAGIGDEEAHLLGMGLVTSSDIQVLVLAKSLAVEPKSGDRITIRGKTVVVVPETTSGMRAVQTDPARATWTLRCRA